MAVPPPPEELEVPLDPPELVDPLELLDPPELVDPPELLDPLELVDPLELLDPPELLEPPELLDPADPPHAVSTPARSNTVQRLILTVTIGKSNSSHSWEIDRRAH